MTQAVLVYIGTDERFDASLARASKALSLPYKATRGNATPPAADPSRPVIFVVDGDDPESTALASQWDHSGSSLALCILAASDNDDDLGDIFVDFLQKTDRQDLLTARISLYLSLLTHRATLAMDETGLAHENVCLQQEMGRLRDELGRADSDLGLRTKVIDKISHISHLSHQINCLDLDRIASVCIESIPKLIAARYASLYRFDAENELLHLLRQNHPYAINRLVQLDSNPTAPMTLAVREKRLMLIKDFASQGNETTTTKHGPAIKRGFARNYETNSCIIAPLVSGGSILGVLNLADKMDAECFDEVSDLPPIQLFCEILGSAMSNIRLYEEVRQQARTDGMTGLLNHRSFYSELAKEVDRAQRYGGDLSLLMVDLDDLKNLNDQYGHQAGDSVLRHVAQQLQKCIRNTDVGARYGGDEFAAILPNTNLTDAMIAAQRMVDMVSAEAFEIAGRPVSISVSVGVSQYSPNISVEAFMNESDAALFEAKAEGKNRVHVFDAVDQPS